MMGIYVWYLPPGTWRYAVEVVNRVWITSTGVGNNQFNSFVVAYVCPSRVTDLIAITVLILIE